MASIITATVSSGLTQQADNSGVLQLASGTGNLVTVPSSTGTMALTSGLGVTEADQWRLNANITTTTSSTVFSTNWERSDTYGAGYIGTGMTESSGVFTFPSTGTWLIQAMGRPAVNGSQRYNVFNIEVTTNNSTYDVAASATQFISQVSSNFTVGNLYNFYIFNVTSTTNCKVRFAQVCEGTAGNWAGSTTDNNTAVNFIRLGAST
jgi:hypothetical protein